MMLLGFLGFMGFLGFRGSLVTLDPTDGKQFLWGFLALGDLSSLWTLLRINDTYGVPLLMGSWLTLDPIDGK